jgi:hypothetical protein
MTTSGTGQSYCSDCPYGSYSPTPGTPCITGCGSSFTTGFTFCVNGMASRPSSYYAYNSTTGLLIYMPYLNSGNALQSANLRTMAAPTYFQNPSYVTYVWGEVSFTADLTRNILLLLQTTTIYLVRASPFSTLASRATVPAGVASTIFPVGAHDIANEIGYFLTKSSGGDTYLLGFTTNLTAVGSPLKLNATVLGPNATLPVTEVTSAFTDEANRKAYFTCVGTTGSFVLELDFATALSTSVGASSVRITPVPLSDGKARAVYSDGTTLYVGTDASTIVRLSASTLARTDATFFRQPYNIVGDGTVTSLMPAQNGTDSLLAVTFNLVGSSERKLIFIRINGGGSLERLGGIAMPDVNGASNTPYVALVDNSYYYGLLDNQFVRLPVKICPAGTFGEGNGRCTNCPAGSFANYTGATTVRFLRGQGKCVVVSPDRGGGGGPRENS